MNSCRVASDLRTVALPTSSTENDVRATGNRDFDRKRCSKSLS